ncbi:NADP-dependent oxidoreductase [Streptomyces albulus]|nr:NADP-dependent oxidoreductase [Streptomyces noursei]
MRAVAVNAFGADPQLMELPQPEPGPGEVLVRLAAAGLNPVDWKLADGMFGEAVHAKFPLVLGADGAGEVVAVGSGVRRFTVGDPVFGQFQRPDRGGGSYAEFAVADEGAIALAARSVTYATSAAVPTAGMTAYNLVEETRIGEGRQVLIVGATGGVGTFVTQIAAGRGAEVIATARPTKAELMRTLGAAETVDHTAGPIADQVLASRPDGVDVLIDMTSDAAGFVELTRAVRDGGVAVSLIGSADADVLTEHNLRGFNFVNRPSPQLLEILAGHLDAGRLTVLVGLEVPLRRPRSAGRQPHRAGAGQDGPGDLRAPAPVPSGPSPAWTVLGGPAPATTSHVPHAGARRPPGQRVGLTGRRHGATEADRQRARDGQGDGDRRRADRGPGAGTQRGGQCIGVGVGGGRGTVAGNASRRRARSSASAVVRSAQATAQPAAVQISARRRRRVSSRPVSRQSPAAGGRNSAPVRAAWKPVRRRGTSGTSAARSRRRWAAPGGRCRCPARCRTAGAGRAR